MWLLRASLFQIEDIPPELMSLVSKRLVLAGFASGTGSAMVCAMIDRARIKTPQPSVVTFMNSRG